MDQNVLFFFDKDPAVLPMYEFFEQRVLSEINSVNIRVQKTQISFSWNRRGLMWPQNSIPTVGFIMFLFRK